MFVLWSNSCVTVRGTCDRIENFTGHDDRPLTCDVSQTNIQEKHGQGPGQGASASPRRPSHTVHPSNLGPPRLHFKHNIHGTLHHDRRSDPPDACRHPIPIGLPQNLDQ